MSESLPIFPATGRWPTAGLATLYGIIGAGMIANSATGQLIPRSADNWPIAAIAFADPGAIGQYTGPVPPGLPPGRYPLNVYQRSGGAPAMTDWHVGAGYCEQRPPINPRATVRDNIVETLRKARGHGGGAAFAAVHTAEDLAAFRRIADALAGIIAGVIAKPAVWGNAADNGEDHLERHDFTIVLRLSVTRAAGGDDTKAIEQMDALAKIVREALLADPTRGGLAAPINFDGHFLLNTDLRGPVKLEPPGKKEGHVFYDATLPCVCGVRIERTQASYHT